MSNSRIIGILCKDPSNNKHLSFFQDKLCKFIDKESLLVKESFMHESIFFGEITASNKNIDMDLNTKKNFPVLVNGCFHYKEDGFKKINLDYHAGNDNDYLQTLYGSIGENFFEVLAGNFSFVLFDNISNSLYLARDKFGTKPFYYLENDEIIVFSTEIRLIKELYNQCLTLNQKRLFQYLCQYRENTEETFYNEIKSVKPGHYLKIHGAKLIQKKFEYCLFEEKSVDTLDDAKNHLKHLLQNAVSQRLLENEEAKVGCLVSGGLDSSSIYCLLEEHKEEKLIPISMNFYVDNGNYEKCDESFYQDILLGGNENRMSIEFQNQSPYSETEKLLKISGQPFNLANAYIWNKTMQEASQNNIRTLFNGIDGDLVVSHGWERFKELFKFSTFHIFVKELWLFSKRHNYESFTRRSLFFKFIVPLLKENFFLKPLFTFKKVFRKKKMVRHILKKEVLEQIPYMETYDALRMFRPHKEKIENNMVDTLFTNLEVFSLEYNVSHQSPFFDLKVVEFCKNLQSKHKLNDGRTRLVLREAMKELLPNEIYSRYSKANLTYNFMSSISDEDFNNIEREINDIHPILKESIDLENLEYEFEILKKGTMSEKVSMNIWCFYLCNIWLKTNFSNKK